MIKQVSRTGWDNLAVLWSLWRRLGRKKPGWYFNRALPGLALLPLALLLRITLLALKPMVHFRFGQLWSPRLGMFTLPVEIALCKRDADPHTSKKFDIWHHFDRDSWYLRTPIKSRDAICNLPLNEMWKRVMHISEASRGLYRMNRLIRWGSTQFIVSTPYPFDRDDMLHRYPIHLTFTESETNRGLEGLAQMGIGPDDKYFCFHARDSAYLDIARPRNVSVYGDYSSRADRDAAIANHVQGAERMANLGYVGVRMGKYVKEPLVCGNPRIIDYATKYQDDFMDIYLSAHCTFFVGQNTGMIGLPIIFRKPIVMVNAFTYAEIGSWQYLNGILIFKKVYSQARGRFLTCREVYDLGLSQFNMALPRYQKIREELGIEIVENTPEEISEAEIEMHQRLQSTFLPSKEHEDLQNRFFSIMRSCQDVDPRWNQDIRMNIGSHFLRTNRELLD